MRVSIKPIGLQRLEPTNIEINFLYWLIKLPLFPYILNLWTPTVHFYFKKLLKEIKRNKIVTKETSSAASARDIQNLQAHMEQFSLGWGGGIQKVAERFLHCGTMAKETIWKSVAKSEIQSCHKLHPQHDNTCLGGNSQFQLLPGAEGLDNTSGVLTFTTSTWETPSRHPPFPHPPHN